MIVGPKVTPLANAGPQTTPSRPVALFACQVGVDPFFICFDPVQIRHAYGIDSLINAGYTGAGHTIVILDAFQNPTMESDLDAFDDNYFLPPRSEFFTQIAPDGLTPFDPSDPVAASWGPEIALDVEWAHGIAPGAKVVLLLAKSSFDEDFYSAFKYAVDNNLGDAISMSWGGPDSCEPAENILAWHQAFEEATRKKIALFAASGDAGSAQQTCDGTSWRKDVSLPASDPLVTGVGGTTLTAADYCLPQLGCDPAANPDPGTYEGETAWAEVFAGSGGGFSTTFDEPPYQKSAIPGGKARGVPDVSLVASEFLVYQGGFWGLLGGTSGGTPAWAALASIVNQKAGDRLGLLNSGLYQLLRDQKTYPVSFHDITTGNNSVTRFDAQGNPLPIEGFDAGVGWDPVTGIGSPIAGVLADNLIRAVSPGDGDSVIATTKIHANNRPSKAGAKKP